jgi:hypothetical protein
MKSLPHHIISSGIICFPYDSINSPSIIMSQPPISSRAISPALSQATSMSSTDHGDTGSVFKAPQGSKSQNLPSQAAVSRPKRSQHQAQLSFNMVSLA